MRINFWMLVLLLSGCATPEEFIQAPPDAQQTLALPPEQAALCITRNIERKGSGFIVDRRPMTGGWEFIAKITGEVTTVYAVGHLRNAKQGSEATIWVAEHIFESKANVVAGLVKGC